ncbi:hypothetical protein [Cytobacillus sp. IB215665]|uniref:hypothetical protein n=1 Tax=Cytobacillus sp. IB215665 TaxID=3097357 RepID=UPI002A123A72|nr:hypothetical protein [Cytobacillus sp. IB215665]MDX8367961.1 hypothetical protein [Cytobacillus sp. IB215665]
MYRNYVDALFQATDLDSNQIALFTAAFSNTFNNTIKQLMKADVPLPPPHVGTGFYPVMDKDNKKRGKDVNVNTTRERCIEKNLGSKAEVKTKIERTKSRRVRQIPIGTGRVRNTNGEIKSRSFKLMKVKGTNTYEVVDSFFSKEEKDAFKAIGILVLVALGF